MAEIFTKLRSAWRSWRKRNRDENKLRNSDATFNEAVQGMRKTESQMLHNTLNSTHHKENAGSPSEKLADELSKSNQVFNYGREEVSAVPLSAVCEYANSTDVDSFVAQGLTETELRTIICDLAEKIRMDFPSYFDFCIISSEEDYDSADELKHHLCRNFDLTGCMINDGFYRVGADIFSCFELMMSRSTKVLFYLTDNFNANNFYRRIQSGAVFQSLMSCVRANREKCVPIFPNGTPNYIPLPLSGIAGLHPKSQVSLRQSINTTYTFALREKRRCLDKLNAEERALAFHDQLQLRVSDYLRHREEERSANEVQQIGNLQSSLDRSAPTTSEDREIGADQITTNALAALPMEDDARSCIMQLVSKSSPSPSSTVSVTGSSAVHVGNQITVNLTINPPMSFSADTADSTIVNDSSDSFSDTETD